MTRDIPTCEHCGAEYPNSPITASYCCTEDE